MEAGMAKRIVLAIAFILSAASTAPAIECHGLPDMTIQGTWQWQIIDGKFCWYLGDRSIPKEQLRWPDSAQPQPKKLAALPAGQKIQCQEQIDKSKPGRWSWRTVEGRQCWFIGDRETPRESLQWPPQKQAELRKQFGESPEAELRKQFDESTERPEWPKDTDPIPEPVEQPAETADAAPPAWQLVNQESAGDLLFLAQDAWFALLSIDFNVGAEFLTDVPMTHWPALAERTPQLDRLAMATARPKLSGLPKYVVLTQRTLLPE
jgi:hypothetical protein